MNNTLKKVGLALLGAGAAVATIFLVVEAIKERKAFH